MVRTLKLKSRGTRLTALVLYLTLISAKNPKPDHCRIRSWVRAPDLEPNCIVQGDVKVKLEGPCPVVDKYVLGLRFKERFYRKSPLRYVEGPLTQVVEGVEVPIVHNTTKDRSAGSAGWWTLHDEEVLGFEEVLVLKQSTIDGELLPTDLEQDFAILVPNTNYPPALDHLAEFMYDNAPHAGYNGFELNVEHMYQYFVQVHFKDAPVQEVVAGITGFQPVLPAPPNGPETIHVAFQDSASFYPNAPWHSKSPMSNYTAEITFPKGRKFPQGSVQNLTVILHRTGYANWSESSSQIFSDVQSHQTLQIPATSRDIFNMDRYNATRPSLDQLRSFYHDNSSEDHGFNPGMYLEQLPANKEDIENGAIVTTSSAPGALRFHVAPRTAPNFKTTFSQIKNILHLNLNVAICEEEPADSSQHAGTMLIEEDDDDSDEEYDWVPWSKPGIFRGHHTYHAVIDIHVVPAPAVNSTNVPVHYLSEGAHSPIFIDTLSIDELSSRPIEERNLLAPLAVPRTAQDQICNIKFKYSDPYRWKYPIYVGETWIKKQTLNKAGGPERMEHYYHW